MIDFEAARATMVESQLRTDRVTDRRILAAFAALPRESFVPAAKRDLAYSDAALEVWPSLDGGPARYLLPPVVLARLIQLASVEAKDSVLDIGCATGYSTAVLAHLARAVTAVEAEPELAAAARETLQALGLEQCGGRPRRARARRPKRRPFRRDSSQRQRARGAGIPAGAAQGWRQARCRRRKRTARPPPPGQGLAFRQSGWRGERLATFRRQRQAIAGLQLFLPAFTF